MNKLLDIGFAARPLETDGEIYGIDIQDVSKPLNYTETKVVNLNNQEIPYSDKFFDQINIGYALHCFTNPIKVLYESNRVLKEDGTCTISLINPYYYLTILRNIFRKKYPGLFSQNFYSFSRINMGVLADITGFEITSEKGTHFRIPILGIKIPTLNYPFISERLVYTLTKKKNIDETFFTVGRAFNEKNKPKEFKIKADLF